VTEFSNPTRLRPPRRHRTDPASSGLVHRHRLDPGGDRQLNRALHAVIVSRRKRHAPTIAYLERETREGKSTREAIRCLKRYLARSLFQALEAMPQTT
jgi:transposase